MKLEKFVFNTLKSEGSILKSDNKDKESKIEIEKLQLELKNLKDSLSTINSTSPIPNIDTTAKQTNKN